MSDKAERVWPGGSARLRAVVDEAEQRTGDDDIDSLRDLASGAPVDA